MSQSSSDPPGQGATTPALTETDRCRLLSSERRRLVLDVLSDRAAPLELESLASAVVERDDESGRYGGDAGRVAIELHHRHLPMIADVGVVDYEPSSRRVEAVHAIPDLR